jgi:hypothetical protein
MIIIGVDYHPGFQQIALLGAGSQEVSIGLLQPDKNQCLLPICALLALCLHAYCCFAPSWMSSADLHVVEIAFNC